MIERGSRALIARVLTISEAQKTTTDDRDTSSNGKGLSDEEILKLGRQGGQLETGGISQKQIARMARGEFLSW